MSSGPEPEPGMTRGDRQAAQAKVFDRIKDRYDEAFPLNSVQIEAVEWLCERLPTNARVLDAGCGTGKPTAKQLIDAGHRVIGIDTSEGMLDNARRNVPQAEFLNRDLLDLGSDLGTFDAVVAFFVLLLLPKAEIPEALVRLRQVLRPSGYLMISMVEGDLDYEPIPFLGQQIRVTGYLRDDLQEVVAQEGFEIIEQRTLSYVLANTAMPMASEVQVFLYCQRSER